MISSTGVKTNLFYDHEATYSNLRLVLLSMKGELFGDPDFGSMLKYKLFEQDSPILKDLLIDDIYVTILTYMPQILIKRENIVVTTDNVDVFVTIKCKNIIDYELDTFTINLTTEGAG